MSVQDYSETFTVPFYECDPSGTLHLSALMNHLVLCSEQQLTSLDAGPEFMLNLGMGWVTTQYQIEITRLPQLHEQVRVVTRATQYNKFFCYRDFWLYDDQDNELAFVRSVWVVISFATRKMVHLPAVLTAKISSEFKPEVVRFPRIPKVDWTKADNLNKVFRVRYFDIDTNHHVNNAHYFDWMLDSLPLAFLKSHTVKSMSIKYDNEVTYGDEIVSRAQLTELTSHHQIRNGEQLAAEATITWQ